MSKILILYTGGTFGMVPENPNDLKSNLVPGTLVDLGKYMPALEENGYFAKHGVEIEYLSLGEPKDSSNFTPKDWVIIAKKIEQDFKDVTKKVLPEAIDNVNGVAEIDYDNDGDFDLFFTRGKELEIGETFFNKETNTFGFFTKRGAFQFEDFIDTNVQIDINFIKKSTLLELNFSAKGTVTVPCDVSNEVFDQEIKSTLPLVVKFGDEFNDENEELLYCFGVNRDLHL